MWSRRAGRRRRPPTDRPARIERPGPGIRYRSPTKSQGGPMQATINGFRMNFAEEGPEAAPAGILPHPLATDLTVWDELTAALLPRYRVVRFDARGHGAPPPPRRP